MKVEIVSELRDHLVSMMDQLSQMQAGRLKVLVNGQDVTPHWITSFEQRTQHLQGLIEALVSVI